MRTILQQAIILSLCAAFAHAVAVIVPPRVVSPSGTYIGSSSISQLDQFLGIAYAEPPVGNLRFANPVKKAIHPVANTAAVLNATAALKTPGVVNATAYGPGCSQLYFFGQANGLSEDCLTLNVIRPTGASPNALLPVLFFIHGGGNVNGQSIFYNGTALVQHSISIHEPVIYVGINYRIGGFGFLTSSEFQAAGVSNLGLKDQYLALQWVHDNIKSFGGDPAKVTIFGESSGAANCWSQLHYAYVKNEKGKYFRGMITQSGAPGSPGYPSALNPVDGASGYADLLAATNCPAGSQSIECLRKVPHDVITPLLVNLASVPFTIDHDWFNSDFTTMIEAGQFVNVPIIHGSNLDEGSVIIPDALNFPDRTYLTETVAAFLNGDIASAANIVNLYFNSTDENLGKGVGADPTAPHGFWAAVAVFSDIFMDLGKQTLLPIASKKADTWGYSFRQQPPLSAINLSYEYPGSTPEYTKRYGVYHGSELPYVFGEATSLSQHTQGDVDVAIAMMNAWISFAYCLTPNNPKGKSP
jgi:carboxylesterase type B